MQCNEFHSRVNEILDDRGCPSGDSSLVAHAAFCKSCGKALENYESIVSGFSVRDPKAQIQNAKPVLRRRTISAVVSIAAIVFLAISLGPFLGQPDEPLTAEISAPPIVDALVENEVQSSTYEQPVVVGSTAGQTVGQVDPAFVQPPFVGVQLIASTDWSTLAPKEMPFGVTLPAIETEWIQAVEKEMSPVTQSVNSTVQLIFRTLSTGTSSAEVNG